MKILFYFIVGLIGLANLSAQNQSILKVEGSIYSNSDQSPLAGILVYQSNSSKFTETNEQGYFVLEIDTLISYELQINHINYQDQSVDLRRKNIPFRLYLQSADNTLEALNITGVKSNKRKKRLKLFEQKFLGKESKDSPILFENDEDILFYEKEGIIKAHASNKLRIINEATGYILNFDLNKFEYDPKKDETLYTGKVYFESDLESKNTESQIELRNEIYENSVRHFLVSLLDSETYKEEYIISWADKTGYKKFENLRPLDDSFVLIQNFGGSHILLVPHALAFVTKPETEVYDLTTNVVTNNDLNGMLRGKNESVETKELSYLSSTTGKIIFNDYGIIQNSNQVHEYGLITEQRVGQMLPLDYTPKKL